MKETVTHQKTKCGLALWNASRNIQFLVKPWWLLVPPTPARGSLGQPLKQGLPHPRRRVAPGLREVVPKADSTVGSPSSASPSWDHLWQVVLLLSASVSSPWVWDTTRTNSKDLWRGINKIINVTPLAGAGNRMHPINPGPY